MALPPWGPPSVVVKGRLHDRIQGNTGLQDEEAVLQQRGVSFRLHPFAIELSTVKQIVPHTYLIVATGCPYEDVIGFRTVMRDFSGPVSMTNSAPRTAPTACPSAPISKVYSSRVVA